MSNIPADLKYTKTHEWARLNDDGSVTVGISDNAQEQLGDMVYIEVPDVGKMVKAAQPCAVVESVKAAFDIYAPVSGKIAALNDGVSKDPALINQSPMDKAWLFKIQMSDPQQANNLMDWNAYQEFVKQNAH